MLASDADRQGLRWRPDSWLPYNTIALPCLSGPHYGLAGWSLFVPFDPALKRQQFKPRWCSMLSYPRVFVISHDQGILSSVLHSDTVASKLLLTETLPAWNYKRRLSLSGTSSNVFSSCILELHGKHQNDTCSLSKYHAKTESN